MQKQTCPIMPRYDFLCFCCKDKGEINACQTDNFYLCIDRIYITRSNPLFIMTLQQLEYILAVDQFRHFAKAAEHCRVTQPTLSAMIQKLEDEPPSDGSSWSKPKWCCRRPTV